MMKTMPSPVDLRIWLLSRVLGWPGRRIASEVGVSQSTVVRTLEQLSNDPPTDQEMQDFVTVSSNSGTPPHGIPVLGGTRKRTSYRETALLTLATAAAIIMIAVAVTVVLISLAVHILSH